MQKCTCVEKNYWIIGSNFLIPYFPSWVPFFSHIIVLPPMLHLKFFSLKVHHSSCIFLPYHSSSTHVASQIFLTQSTPLFARANATPLTKGRSNAVRAACTQQKFPAFKPTKHPYKTKNQDVKVISSWNKKNELSPLLLSLTSNWDESETEIETHLPHQLLIHFWSSGKW